MLIPGLPNFQRMLLASVLILLLPLIAVAQNDLPPGEKPESDAFSRLEDAGCSSDNSESDHVIVLSRAVNYVKPSGVTTVDGYDLLKILTEAGCRNQSVLTWHYDPQSSYVEVGEVNILRDGKRLSVDVTQVHDLPAPQSAIYWRDRLKTLQLPRLEVGDGIEIITYRKGFTYALLAQGQGGSAGSTAPDDERYIPPMPGEYFDIVHFSDNAPMLEKKYVLILPADKRLHAEVYNGALYSSVTYDDDHTEYSWWGLDLPAQLHEPSQPAVSDFAPKVVMATAESWEAKSRWFFDINREQFIVTDAIQAKVDQILKEQGLKKADEEKKAKALLHWVAQNIRYSGQTMGEGEGFTLHSGEMIFDQRSGVCKDIAGMLITMMRAAGMDSYAAMTMAGSRIDEVPADQFNHCVTALRLDDGSFRMYDPTWVPYNNTVWSMLETEQHYLVGTPEGETLSRIRYSPPEESTLKVTHQGELKKDGTLKGTFHLLGSGAVDGRLRRLVSGTRRKDINVRAARLLSALSPAVQKVQVKHLSAENFNKDMWIEIRYEIPSYAQLLAGGLEFQSPALKLVLSDGSLFRAGSTHWAETRENDLLLYFTQLVDIEESLKVPGGLKLYQKYEPVTVDETYGGFSAEMIQKGKLETRITAQVKRRQIPPEGYEGFRKTMVAAQDWAEKTIRLEKEGE